MISNIIAEKEIIKEKSKLNVRGIERKIEILILSSKKLLKRDFIKGEKHLNEALIFHEKIKNSLDYNFPKYEEILSNLYLSYEKLKIKEL